jgi:hypothetical protein
MAKSVMQVCSSLGTWLSVTILGVLSVTSGGQEQAQGVKTETHSTPTVHDGQHDFDFLFGRWKVHCRRLLHPLSGSNQWIEFEGVNVVHRVWDGRANMDEFEAETPSGHVEGMTIRTYSAKSHQWSIYWSSQTNGSVDFPPMVGEFKNGVGEFYDSETYDGKSIFVRFTWRVNSPDSCHWEQAFSADGGKSWETNFIWDLTREKT